MLPDLRGGRRTTLVLLIAAGVFAAPAAYAGTAGFEIDALHEGVWLFRAPVGSAERTNSLVIERDAGLLVVDSQPSPAAARRLLEAIATVSVKPIQYLVLTHAHVESSGGASAFPDDTLVIASRETRLAFEDAERDLTAEARGRAAGGNEWSEPARPRVEMLLSSRVDLVDGEHEVELLPVKEGHYPGFVFVRIEALGLYYLGSLVAVDRNPYADPTHCDVTSWIGTLNSLSLLKPETIVPLHGPAVGVDELRRFRDALAWTVGQVENAFIEGVPDDEILSFAMDSPRLGEYFDLEAQTPFYRTVFERAREASLAERRKRGRR